MAPSEKRDVSAATESRVKWSGHIEDVENPAVDLSTLSRAVKARKAEYTHRRTIRVKVGTWNVASISGTEKDVGKWFVRGEGMSEKLLGKKDAQPGKSSKNGAVGKEEDRNEDGEPAETFQYSPEKVDLYVLGLQEIVDVSSPAEALRPYTDAGPSTRWKEAVHKALPPGYRLVSDVQLTGLLLLIYASPAIEESVSSVSSTSVGTGLMGYMGNKGAVATRLVLGETTRLTFINCHLAAGSDKGSLERRNWDASQIESRVRFDAIEPERGQTNAGDGIGDEDFTFWFGDLNYRLDDISGDDVRQVLARHTVNAYDDARKKQHKSRSRRNSHHSTSSKSSSSSTSSLDEEEMPEPVGDKDIDPRSDPASLQTTISSLIVHDQLRIQQQKGTVFHKGWKEGEISFLPTYKYDVGSVAMFDSSEKHRAPSWCDRILYRTRRGKLKHEQLDREAEEVRERDKEMQARGLDKAVADDNVLFDYDPEVDGVDGTGDEQDDPDSERNEEASLSSDDKPDDLIHLHHYVSHQGILTSDHKPLDAVFSLTFDAVNPTLKAKVHQEVVRELDKAENEARPCLTVVVDTHEGEKRTEQEANTVDFGSVVIDVPVHRSLTVANTSGTAATFSFAERPRGNGDSKTDISSWLNVRVERPVDHETKAEASGPSGNHTLLPGEVANVHVTAHVRNIEHVRLLNLKKIKLEEILVLHVDSGRDHFITVSGQWLPTCFGCSVDELTRMPEAGARSLSKNGTVSLSQDENEVRLSAPRELFRLTEAISELTERAVAEWSMTKGDSGEEAPWTTEPNGTAWPFQPDTWTLRDPHKRAPLLASIREALDTNNSITSIFAPEIPPIHRLELLSETLLAFLNSLSDGVVTAAVWHDMEQQMIAREKSKSPPRSWEETQAWVLESLAYSPAHSVSFTFVTFMLARIANEVTPVPSAQSPSTARYEDAPGKLSKKHQGTQNKKDKKDQENHPPQPESPPLQSPTPASAAAFISAGSFRRKPSSPTSPETQDPSSSANTQVQPAIARRQAVESALASIFARVLISGDVPVPAKEKERRATEERKRSIVEPFLKMIGVDERGPSGGRA